MTNNISKKDKKDWEAFIHDNKKVPDKDNKLKKRLPKKVRSIDLHGHTLENANKLIESFIISSYEKKIHKLIIITGKGLHSQNKKNPYVSQDLSILKYSVPEFIKNNRELMEKIIELEDAKIEDGGNGAFYVYLKKKQ